MSVTTAIVLGSFHVARASGLHLLIRSARTGDPTAIGVVVDRLGQSISSIWPTITDAVVVPVPGHLPASDVPLVQIASSEIAARRGWICAEGALRRCQPAPAAKTGPVRDRRAEIETLVWMAPEHGQTIVLVDDVVRTGTTLRVCGEAIRAAGDRREIVAIALAAAIAGDERSSASGSPARGGGVRPGCRKVDGDV
jgi:phosphoribosylpyrophosphate synthetase